MLDAEYILMRNGTSDRARDLMQRVAACGRVRPTDRYTGKKECVFMWGPGGIEQMKIAAQHRAAGGTVFCFDLGYFHRSTDHLRGSVRLTINNPHPQHYLHLAEDISRYNKLNVSFKDLYAADGHIVLCGLGRKSRAQYGYSGMEWEERQLAALKAKYPESKIIFRPKPKTNEKMEGTEDGSVGYIDEVLTGARLAVCHHSNIGIDCIVLGVPCVTYDGAATVVWPGSIDAEHTVPSLETRIDFLRKISWFNWMPNEMGNCMKFIERHMPEIRKIGRKI